MNREELPQEASREDKMRDALKHYEELATKACWHRSDIPDAIRAYYASLPPAESATDKFRDVLHEVQRLIETEGGATESEMKAIWNSLSCAITESERRSQPPAEGAEEILKNRLGNQYSILSPLGIETIIAAMREFATLHAQRIADKMVEEKLKKEYERGIEDGKIIGKHGSVSYIE